MHDSTRTPPPSSYDPIEAGRFGRDHWSVLAYAETCCVDGNKGLGTLVHRHMRAHPTRHPLQAGLSRWLDAWGTRLHGFFDLAGHENLDIALAAGLRLAHHDDWDCLDDLAAAGLVEIHSYVNGTVKMTESGQKIASELRAHKASGGMFSSFCIPTTSCSAARRAREVSA